MTFLRSNRDTSFAPIPAAQTVEFAWPTNNHELFLHPESFFARTKVNPDYGRPGWTRDCGKRFHRGCDIAPVNQSADGKLHRVMFTDCKTGKEFPGDEPGWIPHDDIFAAASGVVVEINADPLSSTLGSHIIIEHHWRTGEKYYSLYAHLNTIVVTVESIVSAGETIGQMGQTSSSVDAREWMAIAPHLHLEFWNEAGQSYDPVVMLGQFLPK